MGVGGRLHAVHIFLQIGKVCLSCFHTKFSYGSEFPTQIEFRGNATDFYPIRIQVRLPPILKQVFCNAP
jgi:hypothetical protein